MGSNKTRHPFHMMSRFALPAVAALLLGQGVGAKPPITLGNSNEAIKLYQDSALDTLRERCRNMKSASLQDRIELSAIRNGYVLTQQNAAEPGRYSVFAYDQDKRTFLMIDGQTVERNLQVTLKLALPRDYARCRIVRSPAGLEQIEVVHIERNRHSDALVFSRLLKEAADIADPAPAPAKGGGSCPAVAGPPWTAPDDRLLQGGKPVVLRPCDEASMLLRERLARLARRAHGL